MRSILVIFTLTASLSPLLTFAHLWQLKEWRWDRLREHFRHTGWFRQLFGITRPSIVLFFLISNFIPSPISHISSLTGLVVLSVVNSIQIILHRQPCPVWTKKAITLTITSLLLTSLTAYLPLPLIFLPLLQPFFLVLSWTLFKPLDHILKQRILQRAKNLRSQFPHLTVIGITGSAGKTTTKELLAHILDDKHLLVTPEHVNTEMGVAQWFIRNAEPACRQAGVELLIVEMGAYKKGEIRTLCDIVQPSIGIITSIGTQHMALFGSQKNLLDAKAELIESLPKNGHAFINGDSPFSDTLTARSPCPCTTICASQIEEKPDGLHFILDTTSFDVPLHGLHNITNILLAVSTAEYLGLSRERIAQRLRTFSPLSQTFTVREEHGVALLDNTHNLSPESFRESIRWAQSQQGSPKVLLTSGIIELGHLQDAVHEDLGAACADVFGRVIFLDQRSAKHFAKGFGKDIEILSSQTLSIPKGSLLVCNGRMTSQTIQKLLP